MCRTVTRRKPGANRALAITATVAAVTLSATACAGQVDTQASEGSSTATGDLHDSLLRWPLPSGAETYADIDGRRLHGYVVDQAEMSRRYRDQGHPQFWGRITGTSADAESAAWLAAKFGEIGLSDVRIQPLELEPQWMAQSWEVSVTAGGETFALDSAQPAYRTSPTPPNGLQLDAAYVGLGSEADFSGRDVRGKAAFAFGMLGVRSEGALARADASGATAIFDVRMLPGNMRYQAYPARTNVPTFTLGSDDGYRVRDLIGAGETPRLSVSLDVEMVPDLETALVWGTLPGATDETIYIMAHRDGWFDAAGDNASGVASMIGLAEHYAQIPQAERRRTMVFLGLDGHHNLGGGAGAVGGFWLMDHLEELFAKTALVINCEHPSTVQTTVRPRYLGKDDIVWSNAYMPQQWYVGGPSRPLLGAIAVSAFHEFGVSTYLEPNAEPPAGDLGWRSGPELWRFVPGIATSEFYHYFHTDLETPETVLWTGLEASTRAYARIVDEVNKLELSDLQRPEEP
ncbi:MAG TPA: M28 family peptidase [Acidobacteriota bacterium]|nr:M28 family peptidase [Acidobacteriota bacterium]